MLWDLYKQALETHYYEEMINKSSAQGDAPNKSSAQVDHLKCRLLEITSSSTHSGLVNVRRAGLVYVCHAELMMLAVLMSS